MKKTILFLLVIATSASVYAQSSATEPAAKTKSVKIGIHAGINVANVSVSNNNTGVSPSSVTRLNAGVAFEIPVAPSFAVQPEANYSGMGYQATVAGITGKELLDYVSIPVLLKYKVQNTGFGVYIAPQYSFLISAKSKVGGSSSTDDKSNVKSGEFAGIIGAEYFFPIGVGISARYQQGFSDINNNSGSGSSNKITNHAFTVTVGFRF